MQKQSNEDFFVQLLNAWIDLANNNLPTLTSVEEILDQPIFLFIFYYNNKGSEKVKEFQKISNKDI